MKLVQLTVCGANPCISVKYEGMYKVNVNIVHIEPAWHNVFIIIGLEVIIAFHGIGN